MSSIDNHYKTLGVNFHASTNLVRTNMHDLIEACHTVKNVDVQVVNDALSRIFAAGQILGNEDRRAEYDQALSEREQEEVRDISDKLVPSCWSILKLDETVKGKAFLRKNLVRQKEERLRLNEKSTEFTQDALVTNTVSGSGSGTADGIEQFSIEGTKCLQQAAMTKTRGTHHAQNVISSGEEEEEDTDYVYIKIEEDSLHEASTTSFKSSSSATTSSTHSGPILTPRGSSTSPEPDHCTKSGDVTIKEATTFMKEKEKAYQKAKLDMKAAKEHLKEALDEEWKIESNYLKRRRDELEQQMEDLKFDEAAAKRKYLRQDEVEEVAQHDDGSKNSMALIKRTDHSLVQFTKQNPASENPRRWQPAEIQRMVKLMGENVDVLEVISILASEFGYMRSRGGVQSKYKEVQDRFKSYEFLQTIKCGSGRLRSGAGYKGSDCSKDNYTDDKDIEESDVEDDDDGSDDYVGGS